jgi:formate hydrogenlyase subunit 6/NADH:ubiquinone oxidoreductase subunit I
MLNGPAVLLPSRDGIERLRAVLARTRALVEIRASAAGPEWQAVSPATPFAWERGRPLAGVKRFFFAAREPLLAWDGDDAVPAIPSPGPIALVGLHACDLAALAYQDRFFAEDPWYQARRAQAFLVGIDCAAACPGGFCRDVQAGPFAASGFDIDATPLPDGRVLVRAGTEAGTACLTEAGLSPKPLASDVQADYAAARAAADATFPARPAIARAIARIDCDDVSHGEWHALGPSCLACTGCTSVCPTCSCFTVVDERHGGGGTRVRVWDSCLLEGFQREASGHEPAPHAGDRVRRFWTHKLAGTFAAACGRTGCVGCGRCDVACPGSIGALRVLDALGGR